MIQVHSHLTRLGGFEIWQNMSGDYKFRAWTQSPAGVITSGHSLTLTEADLEQIAENIHKFLFAQAEFDDEIQRLTGPS